MDKEIKQYNLLNSHNPYFNRWFSAMSLGNIKNKCMGSHNPYFNRWFSAIQIRRKLRSS